MSEHVLYTMILMYCILLPLLLPSVSTLAKMTSRVRATYFGLGFFLIVAAHTIFSLSIVYVTLVHHNTITLGLQFWMLGLIMCAIELFALVFMYWAFKMKDCGAPGEVKMIKMAATLMVINVAIVAMVGYSTAMLSATPMGFIEGLIKFATNIMFAGSKESENIARSVDKILTDMVSAQDSTVYTEDRLKRVNDIVKSTNAYVFKRKITEYMKTFSIEDDLYNQLSQIHDRIGSNTEWIVYKHKKNL